MNKRQAGEDFYFLHKIIPLGGFSEINTTRVIPSPRVSARVPFGTGASMEQFCRENTGILLSYNFEAFQDIKKFTENVPELFKCKPGFPSEMIKNFLPVFQSFLRENNFFQAVEEANQYSTKPETFQKRFYTWFDAFRVIKYLNQSHEIYFRKQSILNEAMILLEKYRPVAAESYVEVLNKLRKIDKDVEFQKEKD
jgi:hypothetical protein